MAEVYNPDNLPVIPPLPDQTQNPPNIVCWICGAVLPHVMSYSCGNYKCPITPKTTCYTQK